MDNEWLTEPDFATLDVKHQFEELASRGWHVVPLYGVKDGECSCGNSKCSSPGKHPIAKNGVYSATNNVEKAAGYDIKYGGQTVNVGVNLSGLLVVDVDPRHGGVKPPFLPDTLFHLSGRGDGGGHYIYQLPNSRYKTGKAQYTPYPGVDVKTGQSQLIVFPPSRHVEGGIYQSNNAKIAKLSVEEVERLTSVDGEGTTEQQADLLTYLLNHPPKKGNRNVWLTKVAGHFAKTYRDKPDVYFTMVALVNSKLEDPLDQNEVDTISNSIWKKDGSNADLTELEDLDGTEGWLFNANGCLSVVSFKGKTQVLVPVANFELECAAKCVYTNGSVGWICEAINVNDGTRVKLNFNARNLSTPTELERLLISNGLVYTVPNDVNPRIPASTRLQLWLTTRKVPTYFPSDQIGWDDDGNFNFDAGTWSNGKFNDKVYSVSPRLPQSELDKYNYGKEASLNYWRSSVKRVLNFHATEITTVYTSWLMALLLKPFILQETSLFPIVSVVGTSETGKTTGFFPIVNRLFGMRSGASVYTTAALRNSLECVNAGMIWLDDLEDTSHLMELIRSVTSKGSLVKVSPDFVGNSNYRLNGSLVISGESNPFSNQKALNDRVILLEPPPVTNRMSKKDPTRPQWLDIVDMLHEEANLDGDFTSTTGNVISWIQTHHVIERIPEVVFKAKQSVGTFGRKVDALAVVLTGAFFLSEVLNKDITGYVERWIKKTCTVDEVTTSRSEEEPKETRGTSSWDNTLTMKLLPWALSKWSWSDNPRSSNGGKPVWVKDGLVMFSPMRLAQEWSDHNAGKINERTETTDALIRQAKICGAYNKDAIYAVVSRETNKRRRYRELPKDISKTVLERSRD